MFNRSQRTPDGRSVEALDVEAISYVNAPLSNSELRAAMKKGYQG
jgi:hypothetical protein